MANNSEHELQTFLAQDLTEMASEYQRIRGRSLEDPGTAGDEGEEAWAGLLRDWLPQSYEIRTKGRILGANGDASPQVDVVVLRPGYPRRLLDKKLYLAGGVAAVFECKNTLKSEHIKKTWENVAAVNALDSQPEASTPRHALVPHIYYGLLAHGHSWNMPGSDPYGAVLRKLQELIDETPKMRDALSILCIANLASWGTFRLTYDGPGLMPQHVWEARKELLGLTSDGPFCTLAYMAFRQSSAEDVPYVPANPLGVLVSTLVSRLAASDETLRPLSQYFFSAGMCGPRGEGILERRYQLQSQLPEAIHRQLPDGLVNDLRSDWSMSFGY